MKNEMNEVKTLTCIDGDGFDYSYSVGKNGVLKIIEHRAQGEGDKWYYDVISENFTERVFFFKSATLTKETNGTK